VGPGLSSGYTLIGTSAGEPVGVLPLSVVSVPTKAVWPYIQQWHLDVQQEIASNTVATISYVGSKGTHLNRQTNLNQLPVLTDAENPYAPGESIDTDPTSATYNTDCENMTVNGNPVTGQAAINLGVAACGANQDVYRKYQGYADISHLEFAASSIYHALQASIRRNVGGLQLSGAYTYSHSIDDSSDRFDGSFVDSFNPSLNRASSNFDQRHIFTFAYVWDLPFFKTPGVANKVLGGWQYSGIATVSAGTPFSVVYPTDNAGVANGIGSASRPDIVGDPRGGVTQSPLDGFGPLFYNPNAFAAPRGLTFGDAGRNILNNPRRTNFDMAIFKHFALRESMAFEFRAEAYNVFNHTQWGGIAGDAGSAGGDGNNSFNLDPTSGFLRVSSAHNPRILQLGLKFMF
jgi:hypothetical protein